MNALMRSIAMLVLAAVAACGFDGGGVGACDTDTDTDTDTATTSSTSGASGPSSDGSTSSTVSGPGEGAGSTEADPGSSGTTSSSTTTGADSGSSGMTLCASNDECDTTEVCSASECVDAWSVPHAVRILEWDEQCDGAGTNVFFARHGGVDTSTSGCPQQWPNDWWTVLGGAPFEVDFYEEGSAPNPDQHVTAWCWDSGLGCGPIPKDVLHAGSATVSWDEWTSSLDFEVVR